MEISAYFQFYKFENSNEQDCHELDICAYVVPVLPVRQGDLMFRDEFDTYCQALKSTTNVIQWGGASVWKVGGKIFAICSVWGADCHEKISFKCSEHSFHILCELSGIIPAPYLARAKWVQVQHENALSDEDLKSYIQTAYEIVTAKLTRADRKALGL